MDPLSATASVVNVLDAVAKLSKAIARFKHDYALADEDLNIARSHALLLKAEISGLESRNPIDHLPPRKTGKGRDEVDRMTGIGRPTMDKSSFAMAISTARDLLYDIEASFPLRSEPHTWASKVRWAIKDKKVLEHLKDRLRSTESTLQGIVSMEQL
jgi:hypothetical protein